MKSFHHHEKVLFDGRTELERYQVIDTVYQGREARVLFSGDRDAAFSGMPLDDRHDLLFDYIQRLFELAAYTRPRRLLIIGGGTYTLPLALVRALPDIEIDVIEIDAGLDQIAADYFGYTPHERLRIHHEDGKSFLETSSEKYDIIMIDAFSHLEVPVSLADQKTAQLAYQRLSRNGIVAMNIISAFHGNGAKVIRHFLDIYEVCFPHIFVFPADTRDSLWIPQNLILLAQKGKGRSTYGFRFGALDIL